MRVEQKLFKPCREGRHKNCTREINKENPDDVSQPRYKLQCSCSCHQKQFKVPAVYRMILPHCQMKDHQNCPQRTTDEKKNATYLCKCKCHKEN